MNNNVMNTIELDKFSYWLYKKMVNKFLSRDNREVNYQNQVLIPMLHKLFINDDNIDIVDVSTLYKNWRRYKWHDRTKYAGFYTPDILIAKNWCIENANKNDIGYLLLIEVKIPNASDRKHAENEVNNYLEYVSDVILTDLVTWEFYKKKDNYVTNKTVNLEIDGCKVCKRGKNNRSIKWKIRKLKNNEFISNEPEFAENRQEEPNEWKDIRNEIRSIISDGYKRLDV